MLHYAALVAMLTGPQVAIQAPDSPRAPQAIAVISCQVDDLGFGALPPTVIPDVPTWRNLDWHVDRNGQMVCKREIVEIQDKDEVVNNSVQLHHNMGNPGQCVHAAALFFTTTGWDAHHPNFAVAAVGCPTPITNEQGKIVGWHMPECPSWLKCSFSEDEI